VIISGTPAAIYLRPWRRGKATTNEIHTGSCWTSEFLVETGPWSLASLAGMPGSTTGPSIAQTLMRDERLADI